MPRIIHGLRESILKEARSMVLESDASEFSIRTLAGRCGIATGTLYNYFDTKEDILATVMLADWTKILNQVELELADTKSVTDGAMIIYKHIHEFFLMYQNTFRGYVGAASKLGLHGERHLLLRYELEKWLMSLLKKYGETNFSCVSIDAEIIITLSTRDEFDDEQILECFKKLFYMKEGQNHEQL